MNELQFLPAQADALAADLHRPVALPPVRRVTHTLPDGREVSALRFGEAAPELLFLHGAGLNAHTWDVTVLAAGRPALAVDLPGHGDSSWRADAAYTAATLADDLLPALRDWLPDAVTLVGHSLGGLTGAALATRAPQLVRALVVVDISPGIDPNGAAAQIRRFFAGPTDWASRDELVERALAFGLGGSREAAERGVFLNSRVRADGRVEWKHHFAHLAARLAADADAARRHDDRQDALAAALSVSGWEDLAAVSAPLTLVRGTHGYLTDADRAEYADRVPHASIIDVDAGHNVHEERPAWLGELVAHIAGAGPAARS